MKEVLKHWNMDELEYEKLTETAWQLGDEAILKRYTDPYILKSNIGIMKALKEANVPVPDIIATSSGEDFCEYEEIYYMMAEKLTGIHMATRDVIENSELSKAVGSVIAKMHRGLIDVQEDYEFHDNDFITELNGWIRKEIKDHGKKTYANDIMDDCIFKLAMVYHKLPRQAIHRDVHLGNIVFDNDELVGYIDFDISQVNVRIFDLAYMAAGSLAEVFEDVGMHQPWIVFTENMVEGYHGLNPLSDDEKSAIYLMMACIEILFVAYFIRTGNPEASAQADSLLRWLVASGRVI